MPRRANKDSSGETVHRIARDQAFRELENLESLDLTGYSEGDLKELRVEFNAAQVQLLANIPEDNKEPELQVAMKFQTKYLAILQKLRIAKSSSSPGEGEGTNRVKLPKVDIRPFDGSCEDWVSFIQLFDSLVHLNKHLSPVEKMHYLISSLRGRARELIKDIPVSSDNYLIVYNSLQKEFNKPRQIAFNYYDKLLSCEPIRVKNGPELKRVAQTFRKNLSVLEKYNLPDINFVMFHLLWSKLDRATREAFELENGSNDIPSLSNLQDFIDKHVQALEWTNLQSQKPMERSRSAKSVGAARNTLMASTPTLCPLCSSSHGLNKCSEFQGMDVQSRYRFIKTNNRCLVCFSLGHRLKKCPVKTRCKVCAKQHNTLLHFVKPSGPEPKSPPSESSKEIALTTTVVTDGVLFATARIAVRDQWGKFRPVRALLDSASACNFMSLKCARSLGLTLGSRSGEVSGIGHTIARPVGAISSAINVPNHDKGEVIEFGALVLPSICSSQPGHIVDWSKWVHIKSLRLADPNFHHPSEIDVLLGADVFASILLPGVVHGSPGQPKALATKLGWILMGGYDRASKKGGKNSRNPRQCLVAVDPELNNSLKRFWEVENVSSKAQQPFLSERDKQCEEFFATNYARTPAGRFIVPLPFIDPVNRPTFANSRPLALKRFHSLERKLTLNPELRKAYVEFMAEYQRLGHMEPIDPPSTNIGKYYYIPHHGILRPESVSTPLRVVFDASARDARARSLNDTLLPGPKLQTSIFDLLIRFRWHTVVFTGDIRQMYRQILVPEADSEYQRILWRPSPDVPIRDFRLKTVTYGVSSAPFQALRTIAQIAQDCRTTSPEASDILRRDVYVDDVVTGASSIAEAKSLRDALVQVLSAGGFRLRKWAANHIEFFHDIPGEDLYTVEFRQFDDSSTISLKILGLLWVPTSDKFTFRVNTENRGYTKRTILSDIARIFDPLGFLCPLTFFAKYLIQLLWTSGVAWDDEAPNCVAEQWAEFKRQLPALTTVSLPRRMVGSFIQLQVHGFCDASERGYCAVIYCRSTIAPNTHVVEFACAKSKVAPLRTLTIPRLELQAAVLLADLMQSFVTAIEPLYRVNDLFAWSDSRVTLAWIKSCPSKWKTFIANRVAHIQEIIPPESWRHVSGIDNPADVGSRGALPEELKTRTIWWRGPSWLREPEEKWPRSEPLRNDDLPSMQQEEKLLSLVVAADQDPLHTLVHRSSSLRTILNVVTYCHRFAFNCRQKVIPKRIHGELQPAEVDHSLLTLIRNVQGQAFRAEIDHLLRNSPNSLSKAFRKLSPFLDEAGLLRVGGRLEHAHLTHDQKHPYVLPHTHRFTHLLIQDYHRKFMHPGTQTLHNILAERFWIISAKRTISSVTRHCMRCFRATPIRAGPPLMGNLPSYRVTQDKPFSTVAIDYGGPFEIALGRGRGVKTFKGYLCIFVCTVVKAVHLELASELSAEAFLAALKRFVARRGKCRRIVSDQGRNFIGASNQLNALMKNAAQGEAITFSFNPPGSPHFNGLAEAGVKSVKTHLARVIGTQRLTYEEFYTILTQIEAMLNSRPLTPLSDDPNDLTALTPNHFLTLSPPATVPEENLLDTRVGLIHRWKLIQKMHQDFWRRWHEEYIHTMRQRSKWTKSYANVTVGTLVLIVNEQTAPLHWPLGRIVALHPGTDGICRVVTVKTATAEYRRPIVKLCPLPITGSGSD